MTKTQKSKPGLLPPVTIFKPIADRELYQWFDQQNPQPGTIAPDRMVYAGVSEYTKTPLFCVPHSFGSEQLSVALRMVSNLEKKIWGYAGCKLAQSLQKPLKCGYLFKTATGLRIPSAIESSQLFKIASKLGSVALDWHLTASIVPEEFGPALAIKHYGSGQSGDSDILNTQACFLVVRSLRGRRGR